MFNNVLNFCKKNITLSVCISVLALVISVRTAHDNNNNRPLDVEKNWYSAPTKDTANSLDLNFSVSQGSLNAVYFAKADVNKSDVHAISLNGKPKYFLLRNYIFHLSNKSLAKYLSKNSNGGYYLSGYVVYTDKFSNNPAINYIFVRYTKTSKGSFIPLHCRDEKESQQKTVLGIWMDSKQLLAIDDVTNSINNVNNHEKNSGYTKTYLNAEKIMSEKVTIKNYFEQQSK